MYAVDDYISLTTSQYANSVKFKAWLSKLLEIPVQAQQISETLFENFDIDSSTGVQLDILGSLLHVSRILPFQPTNGVSPILNDDDYRFLIKSTIIKSMWDGTTEMLYLRWEGMLSDIHIIVKDNQDMSMDVLVIGSIPDIVKQMIEQNMIIPKPSGVRINYAIMQPPIFAFDQDEGYFRGWDIGAWLSIN
jgi:hypothetical protein